MFIENLAGKRKYSIRMNILPVQNSARQCDLYCERELLLSEELQQTGFFSLKHTAYLTILARPLWRGAEIVWRMDSILIQCYFKKNYISNSYSLCSLCWHCSSKAKCFLNDYFSLLPVVWKLETETHASYSQEKNIFLEMISIIFQWSSCCSTSLRCYQVGCYNVPNKSMAVQYNIMPRASYFSFFHFF